MNAFREIALVSISGTYKLKKNILQGEGFDLAQIKDDPLFFLDTKAKKYVPITPELHQDILNGKIRL